MDILGSILRNFIIITIWPILISNTIDDIPSLYKFAYFYAVIRIVEVSITGMIIYFFFYKEFYVLISLTDINMSISDYNNPRLVSIGAPNSNDAAFVLLGALGLMVYQLFHRFKFIDLTLAISSLVGILFTWSRSAWIFVILYFLLIISLNKKINKSLFIFVTTIIVIFSILAIQLFEERKVNDNRLQTNYTANLRKQQIVEYISAIPKMSFFRGMYDDPRIIASKLQIKDSTSAENYTLDIFTKHGILAGVSFILFFSYFIVSFWLVTKRYLNDNDTNHPNSYFVVAIFATYVSIFLMTQSSLFRNNQIVWIMIGFMSVIKQQILKRTHEEFAINNA
jgi:O-antigen ligase